MQKSNILYTGGTFDLFHAGHVKFLKACYGLTNNVIVSLNTDKFVEQYKGKKPIMPYEERKIVLESCKYVTKVIENTGNEDSKIAIMKINPSIIAIGSDWISKDYYKQMSFSKEWLEDNHITLVYIDYGNHNNTTRLKQRVIELYGNKNT